MIYPDMFGELSPMIYEYKADTFIDRWSHDDNFMPPLRSISISSVREREAIAAMVADIAKQLKLDGLDQTP